MILQCVLDNTYFQSKPCMYVYIYVIICLNTKFGHRNISNKWHQEYLLTCSKFKETVIFLEAIFKQGLLVSVR
jgi:hypothetical protein